MKLFSSATELAWGRLDLPLFGISTDWFGNKVNPPHGFTLAIDRRNLWFIATRQAPSTVLPAATPRNFTPDLWKYDVAELFLANPKSGEYLEFNIAANGSWWASKFSAPRVPSIVQPDFQSRVSPSSDNSDPSTSLAGLSIPIDFLELEISFGSDTTGNVTFIQNSPEQIFLSAIRLPGSEPDFHQPAHFSPLQHTAFPSI